MRGERTALPSCGEILALKEQQGKAETAWAYPEQSVQCCAANHLPRGTDNLLFPVSNLLFSRSARNRRVPRANRCQCARGGIGSTTLPRGRAGSVPRHTLGLLRSCSQTRDGGRGGTGDPEATEGSGPAAARGRNGREGGSAVGAGRER